MFSSLQSFTRLDKVREIYAGPGATTPLPQVTSLSARTFGAYTLVTGVLRLVTAYNINNAPLYFVALWAYVVIVGYWGTEWLKYKTVKGGGALYGSIVVDGGGLVWMILMWRYYVG